MRNRTLWAAAALAVTAFAAVGAQASTLWIGNDTAGPVERWSTGGTFLGTFGGSGTTGTALQGSTAWIVQPGGSDSVITQYNAAQTPLATINFTSGIENGNGFPSWVEDMASGAGNTLWLSGFNGEVYNIDTSGNVLSNFNTGSTYTGIEVVGNTIYTSEGASGGGTLHLWDLSGNALGTIATAFNHLGGLAYDPSDNTLWAGTFGQVVHLDTAGNTLGVLQVGPEFHDGLAIGDLAGGVPEPAAWALMITGFGLAGISLRRRRPVAA